MGQQQASVVHATIRLAEDNGAPTKPWFRLLQQLSTLISALATQAVAPDQSIANTTTLTNITGLSFTISQGEAWLARFSLDVGAALATTGIQVALTTPSGSIQAISVGIMPDKVTAGNVTFGRTTGSGTAVDISGASLSGVGNAMVVVEVAVNAAVNSGTVQLQFAQHAASATALTVRQGSKMIAHRLQ